jgi:hypothetical protein
MNVPQKYPVVRIISLILKILAWVALAAGLIAAIVALTSGGSIAILRTVGVIVGPLMGIIWFVQLYAFGSILSLLVDVEENTRALANQPPSA